MHVEFHGAARTVTGSATIVEAGGSRVLVDCGLFQGDDVLERRNRAEALGFDPHALDALVMTHAHVDHIGRAPLLMKRGFRGRVICTPATAELADLMLRDTAKIYEEDARRGGPPPAFGLREVDAIAAATRPLRYGRTLEVTPSLSVTLSDAGHILGSAHVHLALREGDRRASFGVSGDVGANDRPVVADPTPFPDVDWVQMETTYGDREHAPQGTTLEALRDLLAEAQADRGVVVIPSFALGRAQEILYRINQWKNAGHLKGLPVYVDSPLATRITAVFQANPAAFDDEAKGLLHRGDDPFEFDGLRLVSSPAESERVTREAAGCAIIASSGMCQSGRVVNHLLHLLPRPSTKVAFVGYQAHGTLGRRIADGAKVVNVRGHAVPVNASVHVLSGFSAHADRSDLLQWLERCGGSRKRVFLCHGEERALDSFAALIRERLRLDVHVPRLGERVPL
jgi:metallo-beta-lactamase family protein